ncbi:uncharacterized protein V2V93DRAFT_380652 [Kockiozyma suomiensis]|uniref:uncharacterized protein n=1 Tax=Kockiozyma suomiensis TaxID=1337062 RepID=UPI003343BAF1
MGVIQEVKDIFTNDSANAKSGDSTSDRKTSAVSSLKSFVSSEPTIDYTFDGSDESTRLCKKKSDGADCITLGIPTADVLAEMQKLDFYCALAQNVTSTEITCKKIA